MCVLNTILAFSTLYTFYLLFLRHRAERFFGKFFMGFRFHFVLQLMTILVLGICIDLTIHRLTDTCHFSALAKLETTAVDALMNFWVRKEPDESIKSYLNPIVLVEIDEKTYEEMGEPLAIQREYLWRLIATSIESQARVVIVDFAVNRPIEKEVDPLTGKDKLLGGDKLLADCLENYSALALGRAAPNNVACFDKTKMPFRSFPPVILAKELRLGRNGIEERRTNAFESIVEESTVLFWGSPSFTIDSDYVVRKWRLFERTSTFRDGNPHFAEDNVLPSIPLLTWAILRKPQIDGEPFEVKKFLNRLRVRFRSKPAPDVASHRHCEESAEGWVLVSRTPDQKICLNHSSPDMEQRVPYLLGDAKRGWVSPTIEIDGDQRMLFSEYFAKELLPNADPHSLRSSKLKQLKDGIIVIGSGYQDSGDFHITPIGRISGALWMTNAIEGLMEVGQLRSPPPWIKWTIQGLLLFAIALIFAKYQTIWAPISGILFVIVFLLPLSVISFKSGTWIDFTLPIIGVLGHRIVEEVELALHQPSHTH